MALLSMVFSQTKALLNAYGKSWTEWRRISHPLFKGEPKRWKWVHLICFHISRDIFSKRKTFPILYNDTPFYIPSTEPLLGYNRSPYLTNQSTMHALGYRHFIGRCLRHTPFGIRLDRFRSVERSARCMISWKWTYCTTFKILCF